MTRRRVAYILAPSHSGTTLLALMLSRHPDVCTVGELNLGAVDDPERYLCSCGARLRACPFWQRVASRINAGGLPFDVTRAGTDFRQVPSTYVRRLLAPLHRGPRLERLRDAALAASPSWRAAYPEAQRRNVALIDAVCAESTAATVVDSSKIGIRLKFLLRNSDLDVKVIRLVRDGRAVALTYTDPEQYADARDPSMRGGGTGLPRDGERLPIRAAAHEWRRSHEEAEAIVAGLEPDQWVQVQYESLCRHPGDTLDGLFRFLGLTPVKVSGDLGSNRHVVGNGMRLDRSRDIVLDERWTSMLSASDRQIFESVAGALNRRYGYEG